MRLKKWKRLKTWKVVFYVIAWQGFTLSSINAQPTMDVYPLHWWIDMRNPALQIMVRSAGIGPVIKQVLVLYPGVKIRQVTKVDNPNYLFLDLQIAPGTASGTLAFHFIPYRGKAFTLLYSLLPRRAGNGESYAQGVTSSDFIYFLMPDRFSNANPRNDRVIGMRDQSLNRDSMYYRHGGDLEGVSQHLDYLQSLGVTTVWLTPVLENDMPNRTEHGYAFTNHYKIDPRLGGEKAYHELIDLLHQKKMKIIQDAVYNHVGLYHFLVQDLPAKDWLNQWPSYTQTSFKDQPLMDMHASLADKKLTADGWFTPQMPDLNQRNNMVATFLIQHAIWCVEEFGVDGWRIDTYIYCDLEFMNRCNSALQLEFPHITLFGEAWVHGTANQAYFAENNINSTYKSNLPGVVDFQCNFYGIIPALTEDFGWTNGVNKLYATLSNDFLYKDPMRNVIFLDNHDMTRFFSQVKQDLSKDIMGIEWLLTCRGIPQLYYGTEILLTGISNPDGLVRQDFPGGWAGDPINAFSREGLSADQLQVQRLVALLGNYRKTSSALKTGLMMQYLPQDGLYVYFRYDQQQTVMCIMNTSMSSKLIDFSKFSERTGGFGQASNVLNQSHYYTSEHPSIPPQTMWVLELK